MAPPALFYGKYQAESQVQAGMVPTKSGLLFAGDTHGNLLIFDATNGFLLRSIDTGGALNSGLISYPVGGQQYVAATVGGPTENPSTVAGPLRVVVYGLNGSDHPKVLALERQPPPPGLPPGVLAFATCAQCHGPTGGGSSAPPLARQSQLADPVLLKQFLATVPPPMPRLYPDLLTDNDVELIADYLKTAVFNCGPKLRPARKTVDRRDTSVASDLYRSNLPAMHQLPSGSQSQAAPLRVESREERPVPAGLSPPGRRSPPALLHRASWRFL
jgi:hypothetical protein